MELDAARTRRPLFMLANGNSVAGDRAKAVRILVADDHPVVCESVARLIAEVPGWQLCGLAMDGDELIAKTEELQPDIIVLDLHMPRLESGAEVIRRIKRHAPAAELVIFSGSRMEGVVEQLFEAGAKSFVGKSENSDVLKEAIAAAAEHRSFLTPHVSEILLASYMATTPGISTHTGQVTRRELEVIRHIAQGESSREIGVALGISARTAEAHRATIMRKLGASSTAEIVRYAVRNGIIEA